MLLRPGLLEPSDGRGREPAGVLAEQCDQRLLEVTGGDTLEVEDRDQHLEAFRPAGVRREKTRRKKEGPPGFAQHTRPRSGRCPWHPTRGRPSSVCLSAWQLSKAATSASTACANNARAPLRKTSVSGSVKVPGWESWKTLLSVTAYHSFSGEVEASNPPTIRRLIPSCRHQLSPIARSA